MSLFDFGWDVEERCDATPCHRLYSVRGWRAHAIPIIIYRSAREATVRRGSPASRCIEKKESGRTEKRWEWGRKRRKDCRTVGKRRGLRIYESQMMIFYSLSDGHSVRLGDLGSFRPTLCSMSHATPEEVSASSVKHVRPALRPTRAWWPLCAPVPAI